MMAVAAAPVAAEAAAMMARVDLDIMGGSEGMEESEERKMGREDSWSRSTLRSAQQIKTREQCRELTANHTALNSNIFYEDLAC